MEIKEQLGISITQAEGKSIIFARIKYRILDHFNAEWFS